jgi:Cytochrome c3
VSAAAHILAAVGMALAGAAAVAAEKAVPPSPSDADCLACHEDPSLKRTDGRPLVPPTSLAASVHGAAGLTCVDCHADLARTTDFPHPEKLAPAQCASCHADAVAQYGQGVHAQALRAEPGSPAAHCADCHGSHDILPAKDPASLSYHLNLVRTCGRCHGDAETIRRGGIAIGNVAALFQDSIHGRALAKSGLVVAPNCNSCHGHHDIRRAADPASPVFHANVPATCGRCHEGIRREYDTSIHAAAVKAGRAGAVCSDCHTAHGIQAAGVPAWRLAVVQECGTCHKESVRTYRDGFHGQAGALAFERVAACADCHGAHDIQPRSDPRSRFSAARRVQTCAQCHSGATASFAKFDPHADPEDRERSPAVYYTAKFMKLLLTGVFTFFGIHTALWFPRSYRERRRKERSHGERG